MRRSTLHVDVGDLCVDVGEDRPGGRSNLRRAPTAIPGASRRTRASGERLTAFGGGHGMSLLNGDRCEPAADVDDPAVPAALT
jgi:hypothetical protein